MRPVVTFDRYFCHDGKPSLRAVRQQDTNLVAEGTAAAGIECPGHDFHPAAPVVRMNDAKHLPGGEAELGRQAEQ